MSELAQLSQLSQSLLRMAVFCGFQAAVTPSVDSKCDRNRDRSTQNAIFHRSGGVSSIFRGILSLGAAGRGEGGFGVARKRVPQHTHSRQPPA